ncbi:MAG: hypothetical protein DMG08_22865 [Acidobacteria bacterium]|nr:MAG: hypothetical protein DMG08_22865 [Acidobacteriota bacterium]
MRRTEDPIIDSAIRKALGSRLSLSSPNCPDDNAIAAYLEQKLSLAERARLEDHASTCMQCQEVLALSMKVDDTRGGDFVAARPARTVLFRFSFTLSSLALVVVAVAAGILILQTRSSRKPAVSQVAEFREKKSLPAATGKDPADSVAQNSRQVSVESTDLKAAVAPVVRDEESRLREKARRDNAARETDMPAARARKSQETLKDRAAELEGVSPARKDDARKQVAGVAGQVVRTQTAAGGDKDGLLQVQSNEKPQVPASAPASAVVAEMSAKTAQMTPQSALDAFSQFADQTSAYELQRAKGAANRKLESAPKVLISQTVKKAGSKTFYLLAGYWIDGDCRGRSAAQIEEVSEGEARYLELSREFPGILELRSSRLPVLLHRGDKNYVIHFRTP